MKVRVVSSNAVMLEAETDADGALLAYWLRGVPVIDFPEPAERLREDMLGIVFRRPTVEEESDA